jgi:hypothetical protein
MLPKESPMYKNRPSFSRQYADSKPRGMSNGRDCVGVHAPESYRKASRETASILPSRRHVTLQQPPSRLPAGNQVPAGSASPLRALPATLIPAAPDPSPSASFPGMAPVVFAVTPASPVMGRYGLRREGWPLLPRAVVRKRNKRLWNRYLAVLTGAPTHVRRRTIFVTTASPTGQSGTEVTYRAGRERCRQGNNGTSPTVRQHNRSRPTPTCAVRTRDS